jgi:hypothetical protein
VRAGLRASRVKSDDAGKRRRRDWRYQVTRNGKPIDDKTGFPILRLPGQDLTLPE